MNSRYEQSEMFLERALGVIPLGAQTFSKSITSVPLKAAPFFVSRADGCRMWDIDGNEYVDFVNGLASVMLGYRDADVDRAVIDQMQSGVTFSLSHPLETIVAELLIEFVPSAEKVRFAKNGTDATSAAIRIARAYTGRDNIAVCGYHGWQDWYIGTTTRNGGVPQSVSNLSHKFKFNDIVSLSTLFKKINGGLAAVIMEPMNTLYPNDGFLAAVRKLCDDHGTILIFDETITGFRYAAGGAQELFGVVPDLTTLGKGLANGYPLSALVGRADVMNVVEDIFFSGTFGGETLSLAAAKAVLTKIRNKPVIQTIHDCGAALIEGVKHKIEHFGISKFLKITGHPSWSFLEFSSTDKAEKMELKTFFIQEVIKRGYYTLGTHNLSYAHTMNEIEGLLAVYEEVFENLATAEKAGKVSAYLNCDVLVPLFQVR